MAEKGRELADRSTLEQNRRTYYRVVREFFPLVFNPLKPYNHHSQLSIVVDSHELSRK